jgi:cytochrome b involved in lipid metabolism
MTTEISYYTLQEVKENDFIIIDNNVYDFKSFEEKHPGGAKVLVYFRGKNATEKFYKIEKHNDEVKNNLVNFKVGELKEDN